MVTSTFPINNIYASVLFDTGADRSFISHKFRSMINHKSCKLSEAYTVEVENVRIESTLEILTNNLFTLNKHVFLVDLMPMTIGSFDVIIGINWLSPRRSNILC